MYVDFLPTALAKGAYRAATDAAVVGDGLDRIGRSGASPPRIDVASTPDRGVTSGGDALLRVTTAVMDGTVWVKVNGRAAEDFERQHDGTLLGLVTGLRDGRNRIAAEADGRTLVRTVVSHPATGPIFSGAQSVPFYCETTAFGLAPAEQPHCSAPMKVSRAPGPGEGEGRPAAHPPPRPGP
jgi:hypothetical protein